MLLPRERCYRKLQRGNKSTLLTICSALGFTSNPAALDKLELVDLTHSQRGEEGMQAYRMKDETSYHVQDSGGGVGGRVFWVRCSL